MAKREKVTAETVAAVAAQNAGHPLDANRAAAYATVLETVLAQIETMRALALTDVEPAVTFRPVETKKP